MAHQEHQSEVLDLDRVCPATAEVAEVARRPGALVFEHVNGRALRASSGPPLQLESGLPRLMLPPRNMRRWLVGPEGPSNRQDELHVDPFVQACIDLMGFCIYGCRGE